MEYIIPSPLSSLKGEMMKKTFNVKGMHCNSCEMRIKDALEDAGATSVTANHQSGHVTAEFDENTLSEEKVKELIKAEGYAVEDSKDAPRHHLNKKGEALEFKGLIYASNVFIILAILFLFSYFTFLKNIPNFLNDYGVWLFYLIISITALGFALWQFHSYKTNIACMYGMMIGMTFGMQTGMLLGSLVGATNGFFIGSLVGMFTGLGVGILTGRCCGIMGVMEGMMAGVMGGTMGPMISVMMQYDNLHIFMPIFVIVNVAILGGLSWMFYNEIVEKSEGVQRRPVDFLTFASAAVIVLVLVSAVMIYGPKSGL
jgi:copper chaperone CopZ